MNILLVAPDQPNLNVIPEIRSISGTHKTLVLNGVVTRQDIYTYATNGSFDVIHFATHMVAGAKDYDTLALSNGETLDLASVVDIAKLANATLIFFNLCNAARFGSYCVRNGIQAVIYTTIEILDAKAWSMPWNFYEQIRRREKLGSPLDFHGVFNLVAPMDGTYGWDANPLYYGSLIDPLQKMLTDIVKRLNDLYKIVEDHGEILGIPMTNSTSPWRKKIIFWSISGFAFLLAISSLLSILRFLGII